MSAAAPCAPWHPQIPEAGQAPWEETGGMKVDVPVTLPGSAVRGLRVWLDCRCHVILVAALSHLSFLGVTEG